MGAVQHDPVEPGQLGAPGSPDEVFYQAPDLEPGERPGALPPVGAGDRRSSVPLDQLQGAGSQDLEHPADLTGPPGADALDQGPAVHHEREVLAARVVELRDEPGAVALDAARGPGKGLDVYVARKGDLAGGGGAGEVVDPAYAGDDHGNAVFRPLFAVVDEPLGDGPVQVGHEHAHGRHDDPVPEREPPDPALGEQVRVPGIELSHRGTSLPVILNPSRSLPCVQPFLRSVHVERRGSLTMISPAWFCIHPENAAMSLGLTRPVPHPRSLPPRLHRPGKGMRYLPLSRAGTILFPIPHALFGSSARARTCLPDRSPPFFRL